MNAEVGKVSARADSTDFALRCCLSYIPSVERSAYRVIIVPSVYLHPLLLKCQGSEKKVV